MERRTELAPSGANGAAPPQGPPGADPPGGTPPGGGPPGMLGEVPPGLTLPTRRKVIIMLSVMVSLFLAALDMTIWSVAAPQAVGDLGRLDLLAWPQTSYLLGSTVLVPIIGKLSDIYGRKPFLISGVVLFLVGSLLCGMAGSMWELIGFRLVQGCGAAFILANAFTVMGDYFAPAERPRWAGIVAGVFALASIIGPLVGGVLTDELSWRWVFYINIPIGGLALLLSIIVVPWYRGRHREPIDWSGATLLVLGATPLLLAFSLGGTQFGWADSPVVTCFIVAFAATALFLLVGRRKGVSGIMPLPMFKNRIYLLATVVMFAVGIGMMGTMFSLPFFLQGAQGITATNSGLVTIPSSVGIVVASLVCGQIMARTGSYKPLAVIGGCGTIAALFLLSRLTIDTDLNWTRLYMLLMGASMGTLMPLYTLLIQNSLPFQLLGAGTAANQFFRQIGAAVGTAIFGTLIVSGFSSRLTDTFPTGFEQLKEQPGALLEAESLAVLAAGIERESPGASEMVISAAREALATPVTDVFFYASMVMITAVVVGLLLPKVRFRTQEEMLAEMRRMRGGAGAPAGAAPPGAPPPDISRPLGAPPPPSPVDTPVGSTPIVSTPVAAAPPNGGIGSATPPNGGAGATMALVASWARQAPSRGASGYRAEAR